MTKELWNLSQTKSKYWRYYYRNTKNSKLQNKNKKSGMKIFWCGRGWESIFLSRLIGDLYAFNIFGPNVWGANHFQKFLWGTNHFWEIFYGVRNIFMIFLWGYETFSYFFEISCHWDGRLKSVRPLTLMWVKLIMTQK